MQFVEEESEKYGSNIEKVTFTSRIILCSTSYHEMALDPFMDDRFYSILQAVASFRFI